MEFTKNQKRAIELRNRNIVVSASAGTGKTAVLTERIVDILLDPAGYEDIDRMLVVTFTRAAAAEMRARVSKKLSERYEEAKKNNAPEKYIAHISKQLALLPHSQITTIDSLCFSILKDYYYSIDIDPSVKIADDTSNKIMLRDVTHAVLEKRYDAHTDSFVTMVESMVFGKSDRGLGELIEKLYNNAMSHADPKGWLMRCASAFKRYGSIREMDDAFWMKESMFVSYIKLITHDALKLYDKACSICSTYNKDGLFDKVYRILSDEKNGVEKIAGSKTYSETAGYISGLEFVTLRFPKLDDKSPMIKNAAEEIKNLRGNAKDIIVKDIRDKYFKDSFDVIIEDIAACEVPVKELVDITMQVIDEFADLKKQENVADFSDIEHYALQIIGHDDILAELRASFDHVMIDEYQDSNEIQETLLSKISREEIGENNRFMVGDSKQSIYLFRLADPEIFEKKNREYTMEDSLFQKVYLDSNFRSSDMILGGVNYIFERLMSTSFGGVDYGEGHSFKIDNHDEDVKNSGKNEVIIISGDNSDSISDYSRQELEAYKIADRILELTDPLKGTYIYDEKEEKKRLVRFSDIAILLRSMSGWSEIFCEVLTARGIPVITEEKKGYFSSFEIQVILSMLKIIDNPYQDIPFTAAIRSSFGDFNDEELAYIVADTDCGSMYEALSECAGTDKDPDGKCAVFIERLESLRKKAPYMRVSELIVELAETDHFEDCINIMPHGDRRLGNLKMFIQKAYEYENSTSNFELFGFLQYIESIQSADIDFGEAPYEAFSGGAVSVMSIHKSKGLEFPVVFVSAMNKQFNIMDTRQSTITHTKLGIGPDAFYPEARVKKKTLVKTALERRILYELYSEELRILYVALTRAKNKLIMTGYVNDAEKFFEKYNTGETLYRNLFMTTATYLSWIIPIVLLRPDLFDVNIVFAEASLLASENAMAAIRKKRSALEEYINACRPDAKVRMMLKEQEEFIYPYKEETGFAVKVSVSDIKHDRAMEEDEEAVKAAWAATDRPEYIPGFAKETVPAGITGADRGTMYHTVMQYIDMENADSVENVIKQIKHMIASGKLPEEALREHVINPSKIFKFCRSDIAGRMIKAAKDGGLYVEQPFVMGVPASMIYTGTQSEETIIVQGIIDAFFEEEDGIVLLDYKTDRIEYGEEQILTGRYCAQMENYKMAIEKCTGKNVKEIILYSFSLGKAIRL